MLTKLKVNQLQKMNKEINDQIEAEFCEDTTEKIRSNLTYTDINRDILFFLGSDFQTISDRFFSFFDTEGSPLPFPYQINIYNLSSNGKALFKSTWY